MPIVSTPQCVQTVGKISEEDTSPDTFPWFATFIIVVVAVLVVLVMATVAIVCALKKPRDGEAILSNIHTFNSHAYDRNSRTCIADNETLQQEPVATDSVETGSSNPTLAKKHAEKVRVCSFHNSHSRL